MSCEKCQSIDRFIFERASERLDLGSYQDLAARAVHCATCSQLRAEFEMSQPKRIALVYRPRSWSDYAFEGMPSGHKIWIAPLESRNQSIYRGLLVNEQWIDMSTVKLWLNECHNDHQSFLCHRQRSWRTSTSLVNLLLLDVEKGCLCSRPNSVRYFALSYVWGELNNVFETKRDDLRFLMQPNAITPESTQLNLPTTIRDAMRLLRILGERYLWVDRLSIVQDDLENKHVHIMNMDHIYANAYCTIIAADGFDANHGLRGIPHASQPRCYTQTVYSFPSGKVLRLAGASRSSGSCYDSRGWTFQEKYLSRRCLLFSDQMLSFHCQKSEWREDIRAGSTSWEKPRPAHDETLRIERWPNLPRWADLVSQYNRRALRYPTDAQAAFMGVERTLEGSFPGDFIFGLPEFFFDAALLWQPSQPLRRRAGTQESMGDFVLPSWSWLGWEGPLDTKAWIPGFDYLDRRTHKSTGFVAKRNIIWSVDRLVDWVQVGPSPGAQRPIRNNYYIWRKKARNRPLRLPSGWKLHKGQGGEFFKCSLIGTDRVTFRYPLPAVEHIPPRADRSWPPYLRLRSSMARFRIVKATPSNSTMLNVLIADMDGRWAGTLTLNRSRHSDSVPAGEVCELVAISKGRARNGRAIPTRKPFEFVEELDLDEIPKRQGNYSFYNVLWVKMENGYAVREALGRVEESIWDKQALRPVSIELR